MTAEQRAKELRQYFESGQLTIEEYGQYIARLVRRAERDDNCYKTIYTD